MCNHYQQNLIDENQVRYRCLNCHSIIESSDDKYHCNNCNRIFCSNCIHSCGNCESIVCDQCSESCPECENPFCSDCQPSECDRCGCVHCESCECIMICESCHCRICDDEHTHCDRCNDTICWDCSHYCDGCEVSFCDGCWEFRAQYCGDTDYNYCCESCHQQNADCGCFNVVTYDHDQIYDYGAAPYRWEFLKESWENTRFQGIELELNFSYDKESDVLDIARKYLAKIPSFWTHDSSIGDGAELTISPCTYRILRKTNWNKFAKELRNAGATGYSSGACGLHIHINSDSISLKCYEKLRRFFVKNMYFVHKFSQRQNQTYTNIYTTWNDIRWSNRYSAINFTGKTYEFRCFRSTIYGPRLQATFQFIEAICDYCEQASVTAIESRNSLKHFFTYLDQNPRFTILNKYIQQKHGEFNYVRNSL